MTKYLFLQLYNIYGDFMYIYYIFEVKDENIKLYKEDGRILYSSLKNLYGLNQRDSDYGVSIFYQLCNSFDVERLHNYFRKYNYKNNCYYINNTMISVKRPCIIIKTKYKLPSIFLILSYYNENLFICNFKNDDYFWLYDINKYLRRKQIQNNP